MLSLTDRFAFFMREGSVEGMNAGEQLVYFNLLWLNNVLRWKEWFTCSDRQLQELTTIKNKQAITSAKNSLKQKGWIDFKKKDKSTTLYKMTCPEYTVKNRADDRADDRALNRQDKTRQDNKKKIQKENPLELLIADYTQNSDLLDALRGFVEMRKKAKAPLTEHALSLLLKKLDGLGCSDAEKVEIVNQSVMNNWKGFFALKQEVRQHGAGRDNRRAALEERYQDFADADRDHVYPWEVQSPGGGNQAASG